MHRTVEIVSAGRACVPRVQNGAVATVPHVLP
jgi:hypothetical protein